MPCCCRLRLGGLIRSPVYILCPVTLESLLLTWGGVHPLPPFESGRLTRRLADFYGLFILPMVMPLL